MITSTKLTSLIKNVEISFDLSDECYSTFDIRFASTSAILVLVSPLKFVLAKMTLESYQLHQSKALALAFLTRTILRRSGKLGLTWLGRTSGSKSCVGVSIVSGMHLHLQRPCHSFRKFPTERFPSY